VTRLRPFRNSDPPALVRLWNHAAPESATACPLRVHELDTHAVGTVNFDAAGLIVAEMDGRIVGFVHAGFGPDLPVERTTPFQVCRQMGTLAMLLIEPGLDEPGLAADLIKAGESYLREQGAQVLYAGGMFPLNPFYWGVYGGSEGAGVLSQHDAFHRALVERGYEPAATTVLMEADLSRPEPRDPRAAIIRRQTQIEFADDALPVNWWQNLAIGDFQLMNARLLLKPGGTEIAHALAWDMSWFGRRDCNTRIGLVDVSVAPEHRRKGYARFLVSDILRRARENMVNRVAVQTSSTNEPARRLYTSLGFEEVEQAILYRLPADPARDNAG
jgi:GNAT superfamily N-acetyltransferase